MNIPTLIKKVRFLSKKKKSYLSNTHITKMYVEK